MPWGACWLQEGWQTADLDAHKKPLMCGLGQRFKGFTVLKGLEGFKGLEGLERLKGFKGLRAGKRQTWMPLRSH